MSRSCGEKKIRVNLELHENVRTKLEGMRIKTNADSLTEVVRRSLALYELLIDEINLGHKLVLKDVDNKEREVLFF